MVLREGNRSFLEKPKKDGGHQTREQRLRKEVRPYRWVKVMERRGAHATEEKQDEKTFERREDEDKEELG
jgi:hypothetical protein